MRRPPTGQIALDLFSAGAGNSPAGTHRRADEECTSLQLHPGSLIHPRQQGLCRLLSYPHFDPQTQPTTGCRAMQCFHTSGPTLSSQKHSQPPYSKANAFPALKYSSLKLAVNTPKRGSLGWSWLLGNSLVMVQYCQWR